MNLPALIFLAIALCLGTLTILFSYKEERLRRLIKRREQTEREKLSMVVHELRAPLAAIKGAAELLVSTYEGKLSTRDREHLLVLIDQQAQALLEQVSSILDATKLESGKFVIQKRIVDLKEITKERIDFFRSLAHQKGIHILMHLSGKLANVFVDPERITQVFNNLLSNSLKFTPVGGTITVSVEGGVASAGKREGELKISVSDTGMGIPKEKQKDLFRQFSQATTTNEHGGSGLGLYIVKGIVEAHGGSVSLESEVDKGTTVLVTIPLASHPIPVSPTLHTTVH